MSLTTLPRGPLSVIFKHCIIPQREVVRKARHTKNTKKKLEELQNRKYIRPGTFMRIAKLQGGKIFPDPPTVTLQHKWLRNLARTCRSLRKSIYAFRRSNPKWGKVIKREIRMTKKANEHHRSAHRRNKRKHKHAKMFPLYMQAIDQFAKLIWRQFTKKSTFQQVLEFEGPQWGITIAFEMGQLSRRLQINGISLGDVFMANGGVYKTFLLTRLNRYTEDLRKLNKKNTIRDMRADAKRDRDSFSFHAKIDYGIPLNTPDGKRSFKDVVMGVK